MIDVQTEVTDLVSDEQGGTLLALLEGEAGDGMQAFLSKSTPPWATR